MVISGKLKKIQMLNRKISPRINEIRKVDVPEIRLDYLDNGIPVTIINLGTEDIVKMEVVHRAGRSFEHKKLTSKATAFLLKEGCGTWNAASFAEKFDFYGAGLKTTGNMDFVYSTLFTLGRHFPKVVPFMAEMYKTPHFSDDELHNFKQVYIQKLKEELTKNEVVSYRIITEEIFGPNHPYGYNSLPADYESLGREDIVRHFNDGFGVDNMDIFLSGKITDEIIKQVNQSFGSLNKSSIPKSYTPAEERQGHICIEKPSLNQHQAAVKIGRKLFGRTHPDQTPFFMLNTILGGYFGSRLMTSIREEKGYTYDIASSMDQMLYDGCFYISTDVSGNYLDATLKEVYEQMDRLCQDKVGDKELKMVKNYLTGNFLNMIDGPLNVSTVAKTLKLVNLPFTAFEDWLEGIIQTDAEHIREVAQRYLLKNDLIEVVLSQSAKKISNSSGGNNVF